MSKEAKRISVLGCGWLGFAAAKSFVAKGMQVHGSTTTPEKLPELEAAGIEPFLLKVSDKIDAPQLIQQSFFSNPLLLLNIPPGRRNPNVEEDHLRQIKTIIETAEKYGTKRVIFISSTGVYGDENRSVTEEDEPNPTRPSGKALVKVENYLKTRKDLKITVLRLAGLMGGNRKPGRFFAGKKDVSGGTARVNMVHRRDCIKVINAVIEQDVWGETFNVCADEHPTKKEFYTQKAAEEGFEIPTFKEEEQTDWKVVSNEKVRRVLGVKFGGLTVDG